MKPKKKKKVAVLFSGFIRNWKETIDNFNKNIILSNSDEYEFHTYAATYDITDRYDETPDSHREVILENEFDELKDSYNLEDLEILDYKQTAVFFLNNKRKMISNIKGDRSMKSKLDTIIMQSYCLKKTYDLIRDKQYDYVMRCRFYTNFRTPCYFAETSGELNTPNLVGVLSFYGDHGLLDHVLLGTQDVMQVFFNSYDMLEDLFFMDLSQIKDPEHLFLKNFIFNDIAYFLLPWVCTVKRRNGHHLKLYNLERLTDWGWTWTTS
jgi:hypothetical protein